MTSNKRISDEQPLFPEDSLYPDKLPRYDELRPSHNLSAVFDECHNHIYANEGFLKDKIFREIVKLLVMKLCDEQTETEDGPKFGITSGEYKDLLTDIPSGFQKRICELFEAAKHRYRLLFADDAPKLQPLTLAYIVGRLQHISLTKTPGDIKGEACQAFVNRHQRGDRGEFFTPHPIVRLAVEMIAPKPGEIIADPACGSGGFLIQAIHHIRRGNPDIDKSAYIRESIRGTEFNPDVALSAAIRIAFEGGTGTEIACVNTLGEHGQSENSYDVILTNPPFGSKGKVTDARILKPYLLARKWFAASENEWEVGNTMIARQSPEILFIEKCLNLLKPGGRMAIVVPDGLLQNVSNSHVRFWIRSQAKVSGVVSIPQEAFVPYGTGIKTSLLVLRKFPARVPDSCFMAQLRKIGYDVKGQPIYKRDQGGSLMKTSSGRHIIDDDIREIASAYTRFMDKDTEPQDEKMWTVSEKLLNSRLDAEHYQPDDLKLIGHFEAVGAKPLGELADILNESDDFRLENNGEIRYIAISDVDARTMLVVSQQTMKSYEAPSRATYRVRKGDIITAISGASTGTSRQATALITEDEDGAICSNGFAVLRNIRGAEPLYLLAYMGTEYYLRQVKRLMTGHAIPAVSIQDLSKVLVPISQKKEQKKIAKSVESVRFMRKEAMRAGENAVAETGNLVGRILSQPRKRDKAGQHIARR